MTPLFPPMMTGYELKPGQCPLRKAYSGAQKGKYGAGDILWVRDPLTLDCAFILEPDVPRDEALAMVFAKMVAIGDAIGAIAPPEIAITYQWPNQIQANGANIGDVQAVFSEEDNADGTPCFMIIVVGLCVRPTKDNIDPGLDQTRTTLWDEGCGDMNALELLDSIARHFMAWIHTWEEEGMQPLLVQLDGRMEREHALEIGAQQGHFLGLDEAANLIMKTGQGSVLIKAADALDTQFEISRS